MNYLTGQSQTLSIIKSHTCQAKIRNTLLMCIIASLATACTSTPPEDFIQDRNNRADWVSIETDTLEMKKLNYLARFLATTDARRQIVSDVYDEEFVKRWSAFDYGTAASMTTDLVTGRLLTDLSIGADLAVSSLVGLYRVFNNGSNEYIAQIWLPEVYEGIELIDVSSAREAMIAFTESRLDYIADIYGYKVECHLGCDDYETPRNYVFERDYKQEREHNFVYQPDKFGFFINLLDPVEIEETDVLPFLIGEPLKWKTPDPYGAAQILMADFNYDEAGNIITFTTDSGISLLSARRLLIETEMGRHIMQAFHSTPYSMYGNDNLYPKQFYFDGHVYRYLVKSNKELLRWEINMEPRS